MTQRLRVAVVTGAGSGMGRATASRLAARRWCVVAVDLDEHAMTWADGHGSVAPLGADVASEEGNAAMVSLAAE